MINLKNAKIALFFSLFIVSFFIFKVLTFRFPLSPYQPAMAFIAMAFSLLGIQFKMKDIEDRATKFILKVIFGMLAAYVLFSAPSLDISQLSTYENLLLGVGRWVTILFFIGAYWRPSLAVIATLWIVWSKAVLSNYLGAQISATDYAPVIEMAVFLVISNILLMNFRKYGVLKYFGITNEKDFRFSISETLLFIAISAHFSNYFYSAVTKLFLGDHFLSWGLYNQTQDLFLVTAAIGNVPMSAGVFAWFYQMIEIFLVPGNLFVLFSQLLAVVAITRVRWIFWASLLFDLSHILIFVISGIFFYKWILLNFSIVWAIRFFGKREFSKEMKVGLVSVLLSAPLFFWVATLGWWDTSAVNTEKIYAVTKDGQSIEVPSNFFKSFSVTIAQDRILRDKGPSFIGTSTFGNTQSQRYMEKANACDFGELPEDPNLDTLVKENFINTFLPRYHQYALSEQEKGSFHYDLYPHHIWSMPWNFTAFSKLNLKDIVMYRYEISSQCYSYANREISTKVLKVKSYDINL
jgi:hypothetical protein